MKKILIIIVVVAIVALIVGVYFLFSSNTSTTPGGGVQTGNQQTGGLPAVAVNNGTTNNNATSSTENGGPLDVVGTAIGTASDIYGDLPTSTQFSIGTPQGTIVVNNFYLLNPLVLEGDEIVLKQTNQYIFLYNPGESEFWVGMQSSSSFANARMAAEQDFIAMLGVSQTDACRLDVRVGVVYSPSNPLDGQVFPLSFCTGGAFQGK